MIAEFPRKQSVLQNGYRKATHNFLKTVPYQSVNSTQAMDYIDEKAEDKGNAAL